MANNPFSKATKAKARLRMALYGASGSGKTYSALAIAQSFGKIALIDTERGSASKYANLFDFDTLELTDYHPQRYIDAIRAAVQAGYDALVIDSLTHAWAGSGGVLEIVDKAGSKANGQGQNKFAGWRDATPLQNQLVDAIIGAPIHIIATMRSKTEYVLEKDERGKTVPRKVGTTPIQRDGMEYEFDVVGELGMDNVLTVTKTRISELKDRVVPQPGVALGQEILGWLNSGVELPPAAPKTISPVSTAPTASASDGSDSAAKTPAEASASPVAANSQAERADTLHQCTKVKVVPSGSSHMYLLNAQDGTTIALFGGDRFRALGIEVEFWKNNPGKWFALKPNLIADAVLVGDKWEVATLEPMAE